MVKKKQKIFGPQSEKQRLFLSNNEVDIILFGGGENPVPPL